MNSDSSEVYKIQRDMMILTGAWPEENASILYKFKGGFTYFLCVGLGATMLAEAIHDRNDITKLSEILYFMLTITSYLLKHANFFLHRKSFVKLIKLLKHSVFITYSHDLNPIMVRRIKVSQFLANLFRVLVCLAVIMICTTPFIVKTSFPFPFPYEFGNYTFLMYIYQSVSLVFASWNNSSLDTLNACLMGLASTHLQILEKTITTVAKDLDELSPYNADATVTSALKQCIQYHKAIIKFIYYIDRVFSFVTFVQFVASIVGICNTLFYFVMIPPGSFQSFMLVNYLVTLVVQLFMYCWFGNEIMLKSVNVVRACYFLNWYNYGSGVRKYLFIIMERSRRPLNVTVYKFSILSLTAFTAVIQWSYSYFALLMQLYRKQSKNY